MKGLILTIFFLVSSTLLSQNLIQNGGFEQMKRCPKALGQIDRTAYWLSPNTGTPDYFNACFTKNYSGVGIPNNYFGTMSAFEGSAYAGILKGKQEQEYLQIPLNEPLVIGRKYCFRFRAAAPSPKSDGRNALRAFFADEAIKQNNWNALEVEEEELLNGKWKSEVMNSEWQMFSTSFEAKNNAAMLILGYFEAIEGLAYSYIDAVELYESGSEKGCDEAIFVNIDEDPNNLISNPGFEQYYGCPQNREDLFRARAWRISLNSPDFFHTCGTGTAAVPENQLGYQAPNSGLGYGGFWALLMQRQDYREYVSTQLKRPLEAEKMYCLSIHISLAETSDYALDQLQLLVSEGKPYDMEMQIDTNKLVTLSNSKLLENMDDWMFLHGTFKANGNEQTIMIGNFKSNEDASLHKLEDLKKRKQAYPNSSYYYIDDVGLYELGAPNCPCPGMQIQVAKQEEVSNVNPEKTEWKAGDTLVLRNLQFAFNKADILPQSLPLLDSLSGFLKRKPEIKIQITGHTDSDGEASYNLRLSQARAEAVLNYLVSQGIASERVQAEGAGETRPCADNDSEQGKALNRRVEVGFF